MAAAYRVVVSSVSCYNSVVVDRRTHSHAVHYCSGPCRALSQGLECSVAHRGTCSELLVAPDSPYADLNGPSGHSRCMSARQIPHHVKTSGTVDMVYNCGALERAGSSGNLFIGEENNMWRGKKIPSGGGSTGNLSCGSYGSLKDITEEAINLASGKLKEFSVDKLRLSSSSHITFRKGRKVRPDSFSRRSTDLEIIYGHFSSSVASNGTANATTAAPNDENTPPFLETKLKGSSSSLAAITKANGSTSGSGSLDQSVNTLASLYRNTLGDENLIARLLEKTWGEVAAGGAGGEDIRACLDILLKCSEDLKKCTDIIKQCIRRKAGGGPQEGGASPDSVYRALMTRLSMYLKRLPLELEGVGGSGQGGQGTPGSGHCDLMDLVNSLHSVQQAPFSPIFGSEQPPRYEDVVQSPPSTKTAPHSASSTPHISVHSSPSKALTNGLQHSHPPSSVTQHDLSPAPVTSLPSSRSPSRLRISPTPPYSHTPPGSPLEALYIEEEDADIGKTSEQLTQHASHNKNISNKPIYLAQLDSTGTVHNLTRPSSTTPAHRNDDIDKLLMDLENLSQSMSNPRSAEPPLPVKTRKQGGSGLGIVSPEAQTQLTMPQIQIRTPASHLAADGTGSKAPQGDNRNAPAGEEQEDGALLLRILESIESFAQELVDSGAGGTGSAERNSGKEREVMRLLQGTLASTGRPDTPIDSTTLKTAPAGCPEETVPAVTVPAIPPKLSARSTSTTLALTLKNAAGDVCTATSVPQPRPEAASTSTPPPATPEATDPVSEAPTVHPKSTSAPANLPSLAHPGELWNDAAPQVPTTGSSPHAVAERDPAVSGGDSPALRDSGSTLLIQQTPEVIRVQSKAEKKPGTPPPAPVQASTVPHAPSQRSPSPTPAAPVIVTPSPPPAINIPRFYYPRGLPAAGPPSKHDAAIAAIEAAFAEFEEEKADIYEMSKVAKACECPLYWKAAMFYGAGGERTGFVSVHAFIATWRKLLHSCHDDASRFINLLAKPGCQYLEQEDFIPLLQDIVDTHPGLTFLKDAPEFHSRYITTVIQRIFYVVNRSWTGRMSMTELRRSNFLQTLALLEEEDDINQITDYFSYEHFYVIYCKFWELDSDHDLYIDHKDLSRYNDHASSNRIIERLFSGAVTRGNAVQREGRMSYAEFVWFLISEEDKKNPTSIEYWFRCMDVDGDGVLSMFELEFFYEEQCERMERMGIEPLPFQDLLCQMLDLVKPESPGKITLGDLKRCRMAHIFFDTFFNLEKYLDHEQRDPFAMQKDLDGDGPDPSDWDKYASEEYEILVAEETANEQIHEGSFEDDYDVDDLQVPADIGNKMETLVISDLSA
ncbi:serine/threonine-protein phosphatase 2A regulatory subunit B'' subunit alpha isoform X2 [Phyllopteryx taeniolatus]|uniref:serine/threonine-protein phosphatase 2A regulatory subunit B'' subunit alpha isoform X2 n=1 Tax=Phyllopteryx taeniolatus TaxID=161469 RepID=UPI002AD5ACAF|nr:serine/threonine-protein phosphatase 2A regulatory subunit B'' subunit alpha isoform X2 [Phyllopteryx taeniolatus]